MAKFLSVGICLNLVNRFKCKIIFVRLNCVYTNNILTYRIKLKIKIKGYNFENSVGQEILEIYLHN